MTIAQIEKLIEKLPLKQQFGLAKWLDGRTWQERLDGVVARFRRRNIRKVSSVGIRRITEEVRKARHDAGRR